VKFFAGISIDAIPGASGNSRGSFATIPCTIKDTDAAHDLAILQLTQSPFSDAFRQGLKTGDKEPKVTIGVAKLDQNLPLEGQTVLVSGYPLAAPTLVTQKGMIASESLTVGQMQGSNAGGGSVGAEIEDAVLLDAVVSPGISGGPVYLPGEHTVIGICDADEATSIFTAQRAQTVGEGAGLALVIPIRFAIALLQKNKIATKLP
jgi:hypothetical protein